MIKVDYQNEIFASELRASLNGRGVDCFLSDDSSYLTGQSLRVDGGVTRHM